MPMQTIRQVDHADAHTVTETSGPMLMPIQSLSLVDQC